MRMHVFYYRTILSEVSRNKYIASTRRTDVMRPSTLDTKFIAALLFGLNVFTCHAGKIDPNSIKACFYEAMDSNAFEALKCFEDLDPTLEVLKLRSANGTPLFTALRKGCQWDWVNGSITAKQRNQCLRKLEKFE
jgi:dihydrodipicolinate synthase/N-acetylneuraminate lyase